MILDILQLREFHHISLLGAGGKSTLRTILEDESARLGEARTFQEIGASDGRCLMLYAPGTLVLPPRNRLRSHCRRSWRTRLAHSGSLCRIQPET